MKCLQCGHAMTTSRENVPYTALPGAVLVGVAVHRCPQCGEFEVEIPAIDELNKTLADEVTGDEIRVEHNGRWHVTSMEASSSDGPASVWSMSAWNERAVDEGASKLAGLCAKCRTVVEVHDEDAGKEVWCAPCLLPGECFRTGLVVLDGISSDDLMKRLLDEAGIKSVDELLDRLYSMPTDYPPECAFSGPSSASEELELTRHASRVLQRFLGSA